MYSERYEPYIEEMTEDISAVAKSLALEAERDVPETGLFPKISVEFKDKSGVLDITYWQLNVCSIYIEGENNDKRYLEVSGTLKSGYKISCLNYAGTKSECIEMLRNPSYVENVKQTMRVNLNAMDD